MSTNYQGRCHCGRVEYEVTMDLGPVISCNCSICRRKGHLLAFVPADAFRLRSGDGDLSDYQFGSHTIHHLFCRHCGVSSFARGTGPDGKPMVSINVRCLEGVDLGSLQVQEFDGASR